MDKKTAVVIMNWNGRSLMQEFLPSVVKHTNPIADVIVADNGSTDDSLQWLTNNFPTVIQMPFPKNYGFAEGYNRVVKELDDYQYIVLLNSDVETTENWLQPLSDYMDSHPETAACQPKLKSYRNKDYFEYAGAAGGYLDKNGYPFCRGRIFNNIERDNGQYDGHVTKIFWATGAALLVRRSDYIAAGGLDTDFFAHMEEIDLCWRLNLIGKQIVVIPQSTVYHLGGGTLATGNPHKTYLNFRNNLFMLYKNLPVKKGRTIIARRKILDGIAALMFAAKFNFSDIKAIWRAHRDFDREKSRYTWQPDKNIMDEFAESRRNIIIDYYIKRKKVF
ncbi:MAG: glycosyltransferase family 2 protein [Bacteroidales bacterium]